MASTYTLISSSVLASSQATVTFSSIPATYTDLVLKLSARATGTGRGNLNIVVNGSSSTIYSYTNLLGNGATATSTRSSGVTQFQMADVVDSAGATASAFSSAEFYFPSYTASANKPIGFIGAGEDNSTTAYITNSALLFSSTSAISQIDLSTNLSSFAAGSSFYLYGIKNA